MKPTPPEPVDYATPSPRSRFPRWAFTVGPLVLFAVGAGAYAGSRWLRATGLTSRDAFLTLRTVLEGISPLVLAAGVLWGIVAAVRTRKAAALFGPALCAAGLAFVVYHVFLSVKK
jgi:hypothetical protein